MRQSLLATLVLFTAGAALAQDRVYLNPAEGSSRSKAVAYNRLYLDPADGKPCLRIPILEEDPSTLANGDYWCVDDGDTVHKCCFRDSGTNYCVEATETP